MAQELLSWSILPASKPQMSMGGARPCAALALKTAEGHEYVNVPSRVARSLKAQHAPEQWDFRTKEELLEAVHALSERVARGMVIDLLARREYSEQELRSRLLRDGFDSDIVANTISVASSSGLVNNQRFAEGFVRAKQQAGWGIARIERELGTRGIDVSSLPGWPYAYMDPTQEMDRAIYVASRKTVRGANAYPKLVRFLAGRGFSYDVATNAARRVLEKEECA